jgi:general secretion pathway protein K
MSRQESQRGMVLITVLWAIAFCSVLAMATSTTFRSLAGIVAIDRDRVQADALLSAGLEVGAGVVASIKDAPLRARSTVVTLPTGSVQVSVSDETGRIDIGKAPVEVLASLLRYVGAEDGEAESLSSRIVALREVEQAPRSSDGAPRPAVATRIASPSEPDQQGTAKTGRPPFTDVRQLAAIPGMRPEWINAVAPLVTVYGGEAVNPLTAPVAVIRALPFFEEARLESFLDLRASRSADGERLAFLLGRTQQYLKIQERQVIAVDLVAGTRDGYSASAKGFIVLLSGDKQPYRVLAWNPGMRTVRRGSAMLSGGVDGD